MADVVVAEFMDEAAVDDLRHDFDVLYEHGLADRRTALLDALPETRALIVRNRTLVDGELLSASPKLEVVGRLGVGLDNIDVAACEERGIAVCTATGENASTVAEYVMGALLVLVRDVYAATEDMLDGSWPRQELVGRELAGMRLGLLGFGATARSVAKRALAFEMELVAHDPFVSADEAPSFGVTLVPLDELLLTSHALSVHVPGGGETAGLVGREAIARLPRGALVVNASRGGVVDEAAVVDALRSGQLGGAALDVFADEPLSAEATARYRDVPNLILTPHIAGITEESNRRISASIALQVAEELSGR